MPSREKSHIMHMDQLETPAAVVKLDRLEANISRLQSYLSKHEIANRPHMKTHKIPAIAHMQVDADAIGITCQKLAEAEIIAAAGINDIFVPYNIVGVSKLERLMRLARTVNLSVTADSAFAVGGLSDAAQRAQVELPVLVECDIGMGRCGVQSPQAAADIARLIMRSPGLRFGGLMTYPNTDTLDPFMAETKTLLKPDGITVERVSGGSTPQMWQAYLHSELTEHRSGMYIYGDRYTLGSGAMTLDNCAFNVIATVVSRPTADRGILDSGSKTLSSDLLGLTGYGYIIEYPDAKIYAVFFRHGSVDFSNCASKPEIGERVTIIPNHCCVVTNLFNEVVGLRDGQLETRWAVACRGALQ